MRGEGTVLALNTYKVRPHAHAACDVFKCECGVGVALNYKDLRRHGHQFWPARAFARMSMKKALFCAA